MLDGNNLQRVGVAKSSDGGQTFTPPVVASQGPEVGANDCLDKPWITVDPNTDHIYVVWSNDNPPVGGNVTTELQFAVSTDGGVSYTQARTVHSTTHATGLFGLIGAQLAVGVNGEIFLVWENVFGDTNADIEFCEVPPSGTCTPVDIASNIPRVGLLGCGGNARLRRLNGDIRILELPSIAVDHSNGINRGNIYVVWNQADGSDASEVFFSRRAGNGGPWLTPREVKNNLQDQFMPAIAVSNDGTIAVMHYSRELDQTNNRLMDVFLANSVDAGNSFTHQRVTSTSFDVPPLVVGQTTFDNNFPACYMGEYNHIVSDGENFYLVWGDNRNRVNNRPDPDVFFTAITTQPKAYFAQVVDGGGWRTKFFITNLDRATSTQVRLELFRSDGTPFNVLPGVPGPTNTLTPTINPSGTTVIETIGSPGAAVGWAGLTTLTTARASFSAVDQFFQNNAVQKQVGFLPSLPFRTGVFLIDRSVSAGSDTAVAIANQSDTQATTVTLTLRDTAGNQVGTQRTVNLAERNQIARFITELFPGEVPAEFQGSLHMSSSITDIAASVREDASGAQDTNFPVFTGTFPIVSYFADVVDGGGWATDFGFANLSSSASGVLIETFTQLGAAWPVLPGGTSQRVNLAANGSGFVQTVGGATFARGWARITADNRFASSFQVHQNFTGGLISLEAGDNSRVSKKFSHTFGITATASGINTGYAISNDIRNSATTVTFQLFDSTGVSQGTSNLSLAAGEQKVRNLTDLFPTATSITGSVRITSTQAPVAVRVIRQDGTQLATYPVF